MNAKVWQKRHQFVQHASLAFAWGTPLYILQLDFFTPITKGLLCVLFFIASIVGGIVLTRRFAKSLVRVYSMDDEVALGVVRQALLRNYIPFQRYETAEQIRFHIRDSELTVIIQDYPLNLPIDDHIEPEIATKIEIVGLNRQNMSLAEKICGAINASVTQRVRPVVA